MFYFGFAFISLLCFSLSNASLMCPSCFQELKLNSSDVLAISNETCPRMMSDGNLCMSLILIDFSEGVAYMSLGALPENGSVFNIGEKILTNTTTVWFTREQTIALVQIGCRDSSECINDINNTYFGMKDLKHFELRNQLLEHLFEPLAYVSNLSCIDNQGVRVGCSNGFCQLTIVAPNKIDRECTPNTETVNQLGIVITSILIEGSTSENSVTYACNKDMCNDDRTVEKVKKVLQEYDVLPLSSPTTTGTTTTRTASPVVPNHDSTRTTTSVSSNSSAATVLAHTFMLIPWMLLRYFC